MSDDRIDQAADLCREAAEKIDGLGTFRLRVVMQMLLAELEKERARQGRDADEPRGREQDRRN